MANREHLAVIKRGVQEWNRWRVEHGVTPILNNANLDGFDLKGVDFSGADLRHAFLRHAKLSAADFRGANLFGADLLGALLCYANFSGPTIADYCNFTCANLSSADLSEASFTSADFQEVYFPYTKLRNANLTRVNLRNANAIPSPKEYVVDRVRSYFGAGISDLTDGEVNELQDLCAVFLTVIPDQAEMEKARRAALLKAKLPGINRRNLEGIFKPSISSESVNLELIAQLMSDIDSTKGADFSGANLTEANLSGARLTRADFRCANLNKAVLVGTNLKAANLSGASVYGIAAWDVNLEEAIQSDLSITPTSDVSGDRLTVDQIEVAQFLYLLLNNASIRRVIDTITSKVVLILGRFTPERKEVLDTIKDELRKRQYVPVLFDFEKSRSQTLTETIETLAHMARFVIADLTDAKSILQELRGIVPDRPSLPIQPLLLASQSEPGMMDFFKRYPWFLDIVLYDTPNMLLAELRDKVIEPAECKWKELAGK